MSKDYYKTLGLARDASDEDVKRRTGEWRSVPPDKNKAPGAEERFKEVAEAYEVTERRERRRVYDSYGEK
ncbi:dnaJ homolog subfamily B member 1-like, partial [Lethenteron reissneri]|uniref:dnaJ homolog subfamily B member 1-like n=1 Tax=Lethenteron reissneri TaxID=7753 RepID=UPI002AB6299D